MLNTPWLDPRKTDWTDALNPLAKPGWNRFNDPYAWAALQDDFLIALRLGKGLEPRIYVCPDPASLPIAPGATLDFEVPSEPNIWMWAMNASSDLDEPNTFLVQVTDSETGAKTFSQPIDMRTINPARSGSTARGPYRLFSTPHLFASPGYPVVRIVNTSAAAQKCRVTLFTVVEYDL